MTVPWLQVVGGLALLLFGADILVRASATLAIRLRITPTVVGLTIVAVGTSLPEFFIALFDALHGGGTLAFGSLVGSNIFNIGAILGLSAMIFPVDIQGRTLKVEYPAMLVVTGAAVAMARDGVLTRVDGAILAAVGSAFVAALVVMVRMGARRRAAQAAHVTETHVVPRGSGLLILAGIIGGIVALKYGAELALAGAGSLAEAWGWSRHVIGLTVVAFGTSAPELAVSVVAALKRETEIAIGNIIGSCIINLTLVLGSAAAISPMVVDQQAITWDNWWLLGITVALLPLMAGGRVIGRRDGLILVLVFAVYYASLFMR